MPNEGILINGVVLQEAKVSSEIESIFTESTKLDKYFVDFSIIHAFYEWFQQFAPKTEEISDLKVVQ